MYYENKEQYRVMSAENYANYFNNNFVFFDEEGIDRSELRSLLLKTKIKLILEIVKCFMTNCYNDSNVKITSTIPKISEYTQIKNYVGINEAYIDKTIFSEMCDTIISFGCDDYPQILQCRGSDKFMDQPFMRFVV